MIKPNIYLAFDINENVYLYKRSNPFINNKQHQPLVYLLKYYLTEIINTIPLINVITLCFSL